MVMPDLLTEVKYQLPVINIVLENKVLGFIQHEKLLAKQAPYGIDLQGADWAKAAQGLGAIGLKAENLAELQTTMKKINELQGKNNRLPIVLDAKIKNVDPIDTSFVLVERDVFGDQLVDQYRQQYGVTESEQPAFS